MICRPRAGNEVRQTQHSLSGHSPVPAKTGLNWFKLYAAASGGCAGNHSFKRSFGQTVLFLCLFVISIHIQTHKPTYKLASPHINSQVNINNINNFMWLNVLRSSFMVPFLLHNIRKAKLICIQIIPVTFSKLMKKYHICFPTINYRQVELSSGVRSFF